MSDKLDEVMEIIKQELPESWIDLSGWRWYVPIVVLGLVVVLWLLPKIRRARRRRRPPQLHPSLQKYGEHSGEPSPEVRAKQQAESQRIVATSSTGEIAGYSVVEQIEAVYVAGLVDPGHALVALKATAAMKGANAVTNVRQEREPDGRCSAHGDAVIVRRLHSDRDFRAPSSDVDISQTGAKLSPKAVRPSQGFPTEMQDDTN